RLPQQLTGAGKIGRVHVVEEINRLHQQIVGVQVLRSLAPRGFELGLAQVRRKAPEDARGDALLQVEQFREIAVVAVDPDQRAAFDVGQLSGDAQPHVGAANAAAQHVAHAQLLADLLQVDRLVAIGQRRRARDDEQAAYAREREDDVVDHAFAEISLLGIVADGAKRQDRDRGQSRAPDQLRALGRAPAHPRNAQRVGLHGPRQVLELEATKVLERNVHPRLDDIAHRVRYHDTSRRRDLLEAGCDIDACAEDVLLIADGFADIQANAQAYPRVGGRGVLAGGNFTLDFDRAAQGIDRAVERRQEAITRIFDDLAAMG